MFLQAGGSLGTIQTLVKGSHFELKALARLVNNVKDFSQIRRHLGVLSLPQNVSSRTVKLEVNKKNESNHYIGARYQHTEVDRGPAYRYMNDTEKMKLEYLREKATLSKSLTPEMEDEIVQGKRGKKYLLQQVLSEIRSLENRRYPFPMPATLQVDQWKNLLSLLDFRSRFAYLDMLGQLERGSETPHTLSKIQALDKVMAEPIVVTEEQLNEAVGENKEKRKQIAVFLMHHEMLRQEGAWVPYRLNNGQLREIGSKRQSKSTSLKYIEFLEEKDHTRRRELVKKRAMAAAGVMVKQQRGEERKEAEKHIYYGLSGNVIHLRLTKQTENQHYNWKAVSAFVNSTPLVIDFSYFSQMDSKKHIKSLVYNEIVNAYTFNRTARSPYALHLTNVTPEMEMMLDQAFMTSVRAGDFPIQVTEENHLDLFDKDRLVYLSPDSRNDLKRVSDDDIYVIGALINKTETDRGPLTLAQAKRLKIRHARFPLKRTLGVQAEMNVDACVGLMCDMKAFNDWFFASRWVPSRHLAPRVRNLHLGEKEPWGNEIAMRYQAHRNLMPTTGVHADMQERNLRLTPTKYREMYTRLMQSKSFDELNAIMESHKIKLTEEEEQLQSKYAKLRRKKKQLQDVTKPKQEPEHSKIKKPSEAKDAKEVAKKLLKTGAIKAIKKSLEKEKAKDEKNIGGFKRSKGLERKLNGMDRALSSYQPFSATHGPGGGFDTGGEDFEPEIPEAMQKTKQKNLYENFVKERDREERGLVDDKQAKPRVGHTVYVYGYGISEELLRTTFLQYGQIVNISMEVEKNCGFITYDKVESTERAIAEVNGSLVGGVQLKVSLARRQPVIDPINDASSSSTWSTIAASHSQKGSHRDKREMVTYEEDLF